MGGIDRQPGDKRQDDGGYNDGENTSLPVARCMPDQTNSYDAESDGKNRLYQPKRHTIGKDVAGILGLNHKEETGIEQNGGYGCGEGMAEKGCCSLGAILQKGGYG